MSDYLGRDDVRYHDALHAWAKARGATVPESAVTADAVEWREDALRCSADTCDIMGVVVTWYDGTTTVVEDVPFVDFIRELVAVAEADDEG